MHATPVREVAVKYVIGLLMVMSLGFPLRAQDIGPDTVSSVAPVTEKPYRNPKRALVFGAIIPGAGHIYAGEYLKGVMTYEGTVSAFGLGVMTYIWDDCMFSFFSTKPCKSGPAWPHQALGVALVGMGFWLWGSSARDASRAAERANERHRRQLQKVTPIIDPFAGPSNTSKIGVSVNW